SVGQARAQLLDLQGQGPTWEHGAMVTEREVIDRTCRGTLAGGAAVWSAVAPAVLTPLPADGTRLRARDFVKSDRASRRIVKLFDELARAGGAEGDRRKGW